METMSVKQAIAYAKGEAYDRKTWDAVEKTLVGVGICPSCIQDNHVARLLPWQPGDYWNYAGKACPDCEAFWRCGDQPEYEPDYWMGDAAPGL